MTWRFNPPPDWPAPPDGFVPPEGWQPDPSWPPAPAGWRFWVDSATGQAPQQATPDATAAVGERPTWHERHVAKREARERDADARRAAKSHESAVAVWQQEQTLLDALAQGAKAATTPTGGIHDGVVLGPSEACLWAGSGALVEPRRERGTYQGGYSGMSFRVAKGVRYNVGGTRGHYVPGPEVQTPVDSGRIVVSNERVLFIGGKQTREWAFSKLVGIEGSDDEHAVLIHVSNRQKASGLVSDPNPEPLLRFLDLAYSCFETGAAQVYQERAAEAQQHEALRP